MCMWIEPWQSNYFLELLVNIGALSFRTGSFIAEAGRSFMDIQANTSVDSVVFIVDFEQVEV